MKDWPFQRVTIVGPGLLGGSLGLALRGAGFAGRIVGVARRAETLVTARQRGCIDEGAADLEAAAAEGGLIVLATPVGTIPAHLETLGRLDLGNAVVTDLGSTKSQIVDAAERLLRRPGRFVGSHPMAGSERQGPASADGGLFHGKPCIVTPTDRTDPAALEVVESMWSRIGMNVLRMSADEHDRQTAAISHLPHLASVLLVLTAMEQGGWRIASTGFRDTTRLAGSNPPMRADIIRSNAHHLLEAIDTFAGNLAEVRRLIQAGDGAGLIALLERAQGAREHWLAERKPVRSDET